MKRASAADYHDWVTAYINGRHVSVDRIGVFKWELKIDGKKRGVFETRSEARERGRLLVSEAQR